MSLYVIYCIYVTSNFSYFVKSVEQELENNVKFPFLMSYFFLAKPTF
jgi:hypothetical protein